MFHDVSPSMKKKYLNDTCSYSCPISEEIVRQKNKSNIRHQPNIAQTVGLTQTFIPLWFPTITRQ